MNLSFKDTKPETDALYKVPVKLEWETSSLHNLNTKNIPGLTRDSQYIYFIIWYLLDHASLI